MQQKKLDCFEIIELRNRLINAYNISTHSEITAEQIKLYIGNQYIKSIKENMCFHLGLKKDVEVLSFYTFKKLFRKPPLSAYFDSTVRKEINDYIKIVTLSQQSEKVSTMSPKGAYFINQAFRNEKEKNKESLKFIDFYTTKIDGDTQWLGVANGLDYERALTKTIEAEILKSSTRKSKVIAGITGPNGAGKSTFLRRLALNCIHYTEKFHTLWIENLSDFNENFLPIIANDGQHYIAIIEDWTAVRNKSHLTDDFFGNLVNSSNIKLIIGDVPPSSNWTDYLYGKNIFELEPAENERIILHVLDNVQEWRETAKNALLNRDLFNAPLFLILFVIAKTSEQEGNVLKIDTDDFLSQFQSIVKRDIQRIYDTYPTLSKVLYYWAWCSKTYTDEEIILSWPALLKWADHYSKNDNTVRELSVFDATSPLCKILSYYLSFDKIVNPFSYHQYFISFLHDSFINVFCFSPDKNWHFGKNYILDIAELLIAGGMEDDAIRFFDGYREKIFQDLGWYSEKPFVHEKFVEHLEQFYNEKRHKKIIETFTDREPLNHQVIANDEYKQLINNQYDGHLLFSLQLACLYSVKDGYKKAHFISSYLIENGCKYDSIKNVNKASSNQEDLTVYYRNLRWQLI